MFISKQTRGKEMKKILKNSLMASTVLAVGLITAPSFASQTHEDQALPPASQTPADIRPGQNEVVLQVSGLVCSFCAYGLQKGVSRLPFIDASKYAKGIKLDIEKQLVTLALKPGQPPDLNKLYSAVKSSGYKALAAYTSPDGRQVIAHEVKAP